jgi:hypothetical protein
MRLPIMPSIEFTVEELQQDAEGVVVCGRCCEAEFGIGDVFTTIRCVRFEPDPTSGYPKQAGSEIIAAVNLRVDAIHFYQRLVDRIYRGCTAGLRLSGSGMDRLQTLEQKPGVAWLLVADQAEKGQTNE